MQFPGQFRRVCLRTAIIQQQRFQYLVGGAHPTELEEKTVKLEQTGSRSRVPRLGQVEPRLGQLGERDL